MSASTSISLLVLAMAFRRNADRRLQHPGPTILVLIATAMAACAPAKDDIVASTDDTPAISDNRCSGGYLRGQIYGAFEGDLEHGEEQLECSGMPRPDERGVRLRLAIDLGDENRRLAFIISIPDFDPQNPQAEYVSNVTVIEEGSGRFFSTAGLDNCVSTIAEISPLDSNDREAHISGEIYCVSPLPEINGASSVSLPELRFRGLIDWDSA